MNCSCAPFYRSRKASEDLSDRHGRIVRYIRFSVTDRCNLRCAYCRSGAETFIPHNAILRYEELEQLIDMAIDLGVEKVRLTGGEPFARKGFIDFLEHLRDRHPVLDIRITTNGTLLAPYIPMLRAININALNLSLDTFDRARFEKITGRDLFFRVLANMERLLESGICFKINVVAMRGYNDDELPAFLGYALRHPVDVRFIEFMPMGDGTRWTEKLFWSASDILSAASRLLTVTPVDRSRLSDGPARIYTLAPFEEKHVGKDGFDSLLEGGIPEPERRGRLGLISPLSNHFCDACNRLRITSDGALRTCLFADQEYRLRGILRHPRLGLAAVRRVVLLATQKKPVGSTLLEKRTDAVALRRMTAIGG